MVPGSFAVRPSSALLRFAIIRPRMAARRSSACRSMTPAACNATNSPKLWPATRAGANPTRAARSSIPVLIAAMAGCVTSVAANRRTCPRRSSSEKAHGRSVAALKYARAGRCNRPRPAPVHRAFPRNRAPTPHPSPDIAILGLEREMLLHRVRFPGMWAPQATVWHLRLRPG